MNTKLILSLIFSILIISFIVIFYIFSTENSNEYVVKVEYCNSKIDTLTFITKGKREYISTYKEAVPVLWIGNKNVINVCSYEILSKREFKL
jgi:uncharacterized protein (UPF0333 family)